ncbi:MAG: SLC13 family permease [Bacteroidales bacterium]|jgi:di/tricarboxylate transporter|nr:SLC13 family permease [Bacteroidales bacterium]
MYITLSILVVATVFFVNGKIRSDIVALCALILLMLFEILTPAEALSGFSSSIVIMMIGLFVVGGGIFRTGLANVISRKILTLAGNSQTKLFVLVMLVTSAIGGFVSNTGTVALMLPIVVSLAMAANTSPSRFLMPLAFASSMGGMMTLIGTPPNLVIDSTLRGAGYDGLSFFSFLPIGLICVTLGIVTLGPLSRIFLTKDKGADGAKKSKSLKDLANEYQLSHNLFRVRAVPGSALAGKKLQELHIPERYNINVLEIRRRANSQNPFLKTINQKLASAGTVIIENDVLYLSGSIEHVRLFASENKAGMIDMHELEEEALAFSGNLRFDEIGIAEVVLLSNSRLVHQPVKNSGFREKYKVNILGIQRQKNYILQDLKDEKMQSGDVLLVQGEWNDIARLTEEPDEWVVIGQPLAEASKITLDHKAPLAAAIMVGMVALMVFDTVPAAAAVLMAAVLMVLTGCFRNAEEAYKTINWESIVLIGAMLPMSMALEKTGAAASISKGLVIGLGNFGPMALLAGIYFATSLLTLFISNTATAVLFAPIALQSAIETGASPYPFLFTVAIAASMCFASPFATPPNALVMSAGRYTFMDYVKVGLPLQILFGIVMVVVVPLLWPF